jgi:gamma-glutamylputrescine oxidase
MSRGLPYWLDEPYQPRPPLRGDAEVDACVVGAGVGGLSCARRLAAHGLETLVLERGTVASGASGRNGGFLIAGAAAFYPDLRERCGREWARRLYARTLAAQGEMRELAAALGAGDAVRQAGLLRLSASEEEAAHVRAHVAALQADGFPGRLVERDELPPALQRFGHNGCLTEHEAALHPARWVRALARDAEQAGVRICEGTSVEAPVVAPEAGPVRAAGGSVRARHVVVAADGALPALVPHYGGRVRARRLHMVATAPLKRRLIEALVYSRWGYEYMQQRPDGRLLAGGFSDYDADRSYTDDDGGAPRVWERVERHLREDVGVDAEVTHRWAGVVGYSEDGLPYVGQAPNQPGLWVAGGYSGHGNVPGYMAGQQIADAIAGVEGEPALFSAARRAGTPGP